MRFLRAITNYILLTFIGFTASLWAPFVIWFSFLFACDRAIKGNFRNDERDVLTGKAWLWK